MASISKRASGRWQAKIRRNGTSRSQTFATKRDAEAWARKEESVVERGLWMDNSEAESTTLRDALLRYQVEIVPQKRGAREEMTMIERLLEDPIANLTLAHTRSANVASLVSRWQKHYKPATIKRRVAVLRHLFETAKKAWGMEGLRNPVSGVQLPKVSNDRDRRVSEAELQAICRASGSDTLPSIIGLAVETAMRRGEIANIRWKDLDLKRRVIHLSVTKNGHQRDVPLSTRAASLLNKLRSQSSCAPNALIFESRADTITQGFARAVRRAHKSYEASLAPNENPNPRFLRDLRFHDLRHEATSRLAGKLSMHELAKVTGHQEPRMLMRYYHPRPEDLAAKLG